MRGRTQRTQRTRREYGNERRRRRSYAEDAKGNTKFVWERLEAVFMRVAGHKWLGRRMEAACRCFCGLALRKLEECGGGRRRRRGYAEGAKGNTKFVWKRLEAVFMRVAGHKWLGRRMGAGCRGFGVLCCVRPSYLPRICLVFASYLPRSCLAVATCFSRVWLALPIYALPM